MAWKVLKSLDIFKAGFFKCRADECQLPDGRIMPRYYVLEFPDWVNVVAITADNQIVLVEQYRHAAQATFLEVPGGGTHPGCEDPLEAGRRELLEETGYESSTWINCGFHYPNPALQSNRMHTFLALNCKHIQAPQLDPYEDLKTVTMPLQEAIEKWQRGELKHSLISASILMAVSELKKRGLIRL
jgi:8-oxo-dGTP pyrophosphatase MutT (NUDIX family)